MARQWRRRIKGSRRQVGQPFESRGSIKGTAKTKSYSPTPQFDKDDFQFEKADFTYPLGSKIRTEPERRVIGRMKIEKPYPDGSIEILRIEHIIPLEDQVFTRDHRGMFDNVMRHISIIGVPTYNGYYAVRQSFRTPSTERDLLGGFQSGQVWDIPNTKEGGLMKALDEYRQKGYKQVPYIPKQR